MTGVTSLTQSGTRRSGRANVSQPTAAARAYNCCCSCYTHITNSWPL